MPTYDYRCPQCGKFTVSQGIKEPALTECPTCQASVSRLIGKNVNIMYKCSGFYCTDSRSASGKPGVKADDKTESKQEVTAENKPENKAENKAENKSEIKPETKTAAKGEADGQKKAVNE